MVSDRIGGSRPLPAPDCSGANFTNADQTARLLISTRTPGPIEELTATFCT